MARKQVKSVELPNGVINASEFPFTDIIRLPVQKRKPGNQGSKSKVKYLDIVTAFDIETTRVPDTDQSVMYIWQWQIGPDLTVIGRTWQELQTIIKTLSYAMGDNVKMVVYVHNLSYEFQFLRGVANFGKDDVFAVKSRKVLKCEIAKHFEFRCSYIHSNANLRQYLKDMGVQAQKTELDYSKIRYPWTPLSEEELAYCINDVKGLVQALIKEMEHDGDNLYSIPLTSTGYVRRDAKSAMRMVPGRYVKSQLCDIDVYTLLREAFRGGNTHANRWYAGIKLHNVRSADRSSSYPDIQCNCEFPVSSFFHSGEISMQEYRKLTDTRHRAVLMRVAFTGIELQNDMWGCPYISKDKSRNLVKGLYDNGRVLSAAYLETTITDVDFEIIASEYKWDDMEILDSYHARYGRLPKVLIAETIKYYRAKTGLKNVEGEELNYMRSKAKLNSIYGMMAQDPIKRDIDFIEGEFVESHEKPDSEILEDYNKRAFLCYQWGVWVTAWARLRLEEGIRLAGDGFVYCDTDSVKYKGDVDWTAYNAQRIADSKASGAYATDPHGITHYMGVYEDEGISEEFATLGAKKYVTRQDGVLACTIAGVNKKLGAEELEENGGVSAFLTRGFTFVKAGGTEAVYNDDVSKDMIIDGHKLHISSNVCLKESTYTLGITSEYERLLTKYGGHDILIG